MDDAKILTGSSFLPHENPKKLIFMLHGYGDTADNFIHIAGVLDQPVWQANYFALNAPILIPNYSMGRQWFELYPNGVYISEAGPNEIKIIRSQVKLVVQQIEQTIIKQKNKYNLSFRDCLLLGFSQGGIMTFEFGNFFQDQLAGLVVMSGRIMEQNEITNQYVLQTPIFISHGDQDDVLPIKNFFKSCEYLEKNKCIFEKHLLTGDTHTISPKAIDLLQKFIKKNL